MRRVAYIHAKTGSATARSVSGDDGESVPNEHEDLVEHVLRDAHDLDSQAHEVDWRGQDQIRGHVVQ